MPVPNADPIADAIAAHPRLHLDQSAIVGVSGGRDSAVLLHALAQAGFRELIVAHIDHSLRPESHDDAMFVGELADQYGLTFENTTIEVKKLAKERKLSVEAAARAARYEFFAEVARAHWCPRVLVAHHADDQVETFLLNLLRGSGSNGLGGMRPVTVREEHGGRLEIHRPLLGVWREEIDVYAQKHEVKFREDVSNLDRKYVRNRVRHDLLPALSQSLERDVRRSLWRSAEILAAESEYLASQVPHELAEELRVDELRALPLALCRRVIHVWLRLRGVTDVSYDDIEAVRGLIASTRRAKVNVAGGKHVRRREKKLFVEA